jgi:sensor histidine kinase YesM
MNPHFIFNSLNSIQNYILQQKPLDAARYLSKFSKLMRRILDQSFSNMRPLSEIVETLKMYMELEAFRFSNEFSYEIKIDDEDKIADVKLPPLLLQPYVENAIIHGLMPKVGDKKLLIHLYFQKNVLHCVVDDNGMGRGNKLLVNDGHISRGQKLTNDMLASMKTLINADAKIEITDKKGVDNEPLGTKIDIIIPLTNKL